MLDIILRDEGEDGPNIDGNFHSDGRSIQSIFLQYQFHTVDNLSRNTTKAKQIKIAKIAAL